MLSTHGWVWRLVGIYVSVNANSPVSTSSRTLGNRNPDLSARGHCLDSAACWFSTMAATARISWQSRFLLATTACEELRSVFPNGKLRYNTCDARNLYRQLETARRCGESHADYGATTRIVAVRSVAAGSIRGLRRMPRTRSRSRTAMNGGACFTPPLLLTYVPPAQNVGGPVLWDSLPGYPVILILLPELFHHGTF